MNKHFIFFAIISVAGLWTGCQTQSQDARFETFYAVHQKAFAKHFSSPKYALTDSLAAAKVSDTELFMDVDFCNGQLDKLARFDLEKLSPEHREQWLAAFREVKTQLSQIEAFVKKNQVVVPGDSLPAME